MLGIIADDYTGATDVAGYLVREGTPTVQFFGVPDDGVRVPAGFGAVVVALKSRAEAPQVAVRESLAACEWLTTRAGAERVYFKYCSTFDSTEQGNIGPVALALAEVLGERVVLVAPSAPENGRTVYQGKLFVHDQLLSESPMRDHPVNPMRDSDLRRLLLAQGVPEVSLVDHTVVRQGPRAVTTRLGMAGPYAPVLVVADAVTNEDLDCLAAVGGQFRLTSGSAGLGAALGRRLRGTFVEPSWPRFPDGGRMVLSGSCSQATLAQVEAYRARRPSLKLDGFSDWSGMVESGRAFLEQHGGDDPLIYTSSSPAEVARVQARWGRQEAARRLEGVLGELARIGVSLGLRTIVVAGGETSGAVVRALDVRSVAVGKEIAVGVPWNVSLGDVPVALALKSGNFGGPEFFQEALDVAGRNQVRSDA